MKKNKIIAALGILLITTGCAENKTNKKDEHTTTTEVENLPKAAEPEIYPYYYGSGNECSIDVKMTNSGSFLVTLVKFAGGDSLTGTFQKGELYVSGKAAVKSNEAKFQGLLEWKNGAETATLSLLGEPCTGANGQQYSSRFAISFGKNKWGGCGSYSE